MLRPRISCEGCWACHHGRFKCHAHFNPRLIAELVARLAEDPQNPQLSILPMPDLDLLRSGRDGRGLYNLEPFNLDEATVPASARSLLDNFWREYFLHISGKFEDALPKAGHELTRLYPNLTAGLRDELSHIIGDYRKTLRASQILSSEYWQGASAGVRLFAGFAQMRLQNDDFSHQAWERSIRELLIAHTALDPAC